MKLEKLLLPLLIILAIVAPVAGAHISKFNGVNASPIDQVSTLRLAEGQSGNVTVVFTNNYQLNTVNKELVIAFTSNISKYTYSATGDTANLTVVRNPTNITFEYSGSTSVNVTDVSLTFDFGPSLKNTTGISTSDVFNTTKVLAYVSYYNTSKTPDNTTEKIMYLVYSPRKVYESVMYIASPKNATLVTIDDVVHINFTNATTNRGDLVITTYRGYYNDKLVPIQKGIITVMLNDTYITSVMTNKTKNCTEIGSLDAGGYNKLSYIDTATNYTKLISICANFWNTNGTLKNGMVLEYTIDPIGGIPYTLTNNYSVNITSAMMSAAAPKAAMWWFSWEIAGIPVLAWIAIVFAVTLFVMIIYRYSKGMRPIPKSGAAQAAILISWTYLAILSSLKNVWHSAFEWIANNPAPSMVIILLSFMLLWLAKVHFLTTRE